MLVYIAISRAYLGYVDTARVRVREALSEASRLEHVYTLTHASLYAAWIECAVGSPYDIRDHAERAVSLASEHGFPFERAWGLIYRGSSISALGEPEEGYAQVARGLSMHRATGSVLCTAFGLTLLAGTCGRLGRTTEGLGYLSEAEQLIKTSNDASMKRSCTGCGGIC
jgi:hypothetical protein